MVAGVITGIVSTVGQALGLIKDGKASEAELLLVQVQAQASQLQGQIEINKQEAAHSSIFVAGWRPFIGWVCGCGFAFTYIVKPYIFPFLYGSFPELATLPDVDGGLMELTLGMLGIAGMRSWEKNKGIAR